MSLTTLPGGLFYPAFPEWARINGPFFNTPLLIDATGEKAAFIGRVWWPGATSGQTKNISRVGFRFGTVTKAGGSALTVSLQDVSLTGSAPSPDETQDQTVAIANGNASFASNTWIRTGTLSANRTVSFGERLGVVIEFDGSGRLSSDSVVISALAAGQRTSDCLCTLKTSGSWGEQSVIPNLILEFDDGTFGTLDGAYALSAINNHSFKSDTGTSDEFAVVVNVPVPVTIDGLYCYVQPSTTAADYELILYSGTTAVATVTVDANTIAAAYRQITVPIAPVDLSANTDYYVAVRPNQATATVATYSYDVNDANHLTVASGGIACQYATRLDQGSWAAKTATRRLLAGVRISRVHDGTGGGGSVFGSPVIKAGMNQ